MIVAFFGHREMVVTDEINSKIKNAIKDSISIGADTFYCGGYGDFDNRIALLLRELKLIYSNIKLFFITPYITEGYREKLKEIEKKRIYDGIIYYGKETVPYKYAISKRNEWMIDKADMIIAFVKYNYGGAYKSLKYAARKNKKIINLAGLDNE